MSNLKAVWMANAFLEAANQAAHEFFAEMAWHGPRILVALEQTRPVSASVMSSEILLSVGECDALALACTLAIRELVARHEQQTAADRRYRRALVDALAQLSKVGL